MQMFVARFASRNLSILLEASDIIAGSTKRKVATRAVAKRGYLCARCVKAVACSCLCSP